MDNEQYRAVEVQIAPNMKEAAEGLRRSLEGAGFEVTPLMSVDKDIERGYGFEVNLDSRLNLVVDVNLLLTDGDERGFFAHEDGTSPGFGLLLETGCSDATTPFLWAPYNYTPEVGTNSVPELLRRISMLDEATATALAQTLATRRDAARLHASAPGSAPEAPPVAPGALEFSVDGGLTYQPATTGVRLRYRQVDVPGEDAPGELHIHATSEGMITDLWVSRESDLDHNLGTVSQQLGDLIGDLADQGSSEDLARDRG